MTDIRIGGPWPTGARDRSEPLQLGDAPQTVAPVFTEVTQAVNPEHPEHGPVTFVPGEAKPKWFVERELAAQAVPPAPEPPKKGRKPVTET